MAEALLANGVAVYQIGTEAFTGGPVHFSVANFAAALTT